jgi:DNA-binding CsgD family transcriptional regulator
VFEEVALMSFPAALPEGAPSQPSLDEDLATTLADSARGLYEDARLVPLLRRLMTTSCTLTGSIGSSISIVDPAAGRYTKVAERGTACRLGQTFPLEEGVTGRVMASRRPVVLESYRDIATGHLPPESRASDGAVVAIPIWWRGEVIGANVVFAGCRRTFRLSEIDQLEAVTQVVAPGIVTAATRDLGMADLFRRSGPPQDHQRPAAVTSDGGPASVAELALGLTSLVSRVALQEKAAVDPVQVRVLQDEAVLRLQVRADTERGAGWQDLVDGADGTVQVVVAGPDLARVAPAGPLTPFTAREQQVAALLSQGFSDRAIADALHISPKTAEKHVGAVLRKTCSTSRTAAVVRALTQGWLSGGPMTTS